MWFYAKDGRKVGPVSDGELDSLAASDVIDASTLVWKEGMADWLPLGTARPGVPIPKAGQETCSQCGTFHSPDDLVTLSGLKICGACKPKVMQRIKEGRPFTNLENAWKDNKSVVIEAGSDLPKRCFRCNSTDICAAVAERNFTLQHSFSIKIYLCHSCERTNRFRNGVFGIVIATAAVLNSFSGPPSFGTAVFGLSAVLGSILILSRLDKPARLKKVEGTTLWLSGAGKPFLNSLPQWPN